MPSHLWFLQAHRKHNSNPTRFWTVHFASRHNVASMLWKKSVDVYWDENILMMNHCYLIILLCIVRWKYNTSPQIQPKNTKNDKTVSAHTMNVIDFRAPMMIFGGWDFLGGNVERGLLTSSIKVLRNSRSASNVFSGRNWEMLAQTKSPPRTPS